MTAIKQSDLAKEWPKTRQRQWLWAAVHGGTRSQLWQAASAWHHKPCQGLGKYRHVKRCLQLCKHRFSPTTVSKELTMAMGKQRLATVALGLDFDLKLFHIFCGDAHMHLGLEGMS